MSDLRFIFFVCEHVRFFKIGSMVNVSVNATKEKDQEERYLGDGEDVHTGPGKESRDG